MTVDFWSSSQWANWTLKPIDSHSFEEQVVYTINAIDSLADQLPKFVRNVHLHYTAMVYAHRYFSIILKKEDSTRPAIDGQLCCEVATLALAVAVESDGRSITQPTWDAAIMKIFPCEVVHRGILSAVESGKSQFVETLGFDLFVYNPFETLSLLLADLPVGTSPSVSNVAFGIVNSLYRTSVIVENPPYVVALAALVGGLLLTDSDPATVKAVLDQSPVEVELVKAILCTRLHAFISELELPLKNPPEVENMPSPSARTGRSVSRQSSRIPSTRSAGQQSGSTNKRKRGVTKADDLSWALLPPLDENSVSDIAGMRRPVSLSELRILRELSRMHPPGGLIQLVNVRLYSSAEEGIYRPHGSAFVVNGSFDSNGSQFDSIVRLLRDYESLVDVAEQLLGAVLFLNELKICHFGIEPQNIMVTNEGVKIASLATATVLPTIPTSQPGLCYRAPELLLGATGGVKDDSLAVDLWSLGCVLAEITRIFSTRNRYEDPLFKITEVLPEKPKERFPVVDPLVYTNCRLLIRIAERLNKGALPSKDVWPDVHKRANYEAFAKLLQYKLSHFPEKKGSISDDVRAYMKDAHEGVMTEIVMALLRWSPERRVNPRVCLTRIIKFRIN